MAGRFTEAEWEVIEKELESAPQSYGLPEGGREKSLVLGSFNIRKLGKAQGRKRELEFMARFCAACDLVAIQEVQDNLDGLRQLKKCTEKRSSKEYGLVLSDITGEVPGEEGMAERLAFMYRRERIRRLELASDLTFDRTAVLRRLAKNKEAWLAAIYTYKWQLKEFCEKRVKNKPKLEPLAFLTFVRTPYVVAFEAPAANDALPLTFTAVNAHLVYGTMREREEEFRALIEWLINRLKSADRMLTPNFILIGDLNLNFDNPKSDGKRIDAQIRKLNKETFGNANERRIYFPFLDEHPISKKILRTNARASQTFDHIAFFNDAAEKRLPNDQWRVKIKNGDLDGFDFGVFNFVDLFTGALNAKSNISLSKKFEHSVSDHLPIWVRLPRPGFSS